MKLKFIHNFRVLEIVDCTEIELEQLKIMTLAKWVQFKRNGFGKNTREFKEKSYLHHGRYIPGGFWHKALSLKNIGYDVTIENLSDFTRNISYDDFQDWCVEINTKYKTPYWYQSKGVWLGIKYRISRGQFATGAGKTFMMYLMSRWLLEHELEDHEKVLIVVPSITLVRQTAADFNEYHLDGDYQVDQIYGGSKRTKDSRIVVGNIDSLVNYDGDFFSEFGAVLYDEAHKLASDTYQRINEYTMQNNLKVIWAASGTFHPIKDAKDFPAMSISGPVLMDVKAHQLIKEGALTPVKIKQVKFKYSPEVNLRFYSQEELENDANLYQIETKFVRRIKERVIKIGQIVEKIKFNQLLLFKDRAYCHIFHKFLEAKLPDYRVMTIHGDIKADERDEIKELTETNMKVIICATYGTMSTGVSINNLSTLHFVEGSKSFIMVQQSIGRTLRLHKDKKEAILMDYSDKFEKPNDDFPGPKDNISQRHARSRRAIYKKEKFPFDGHWVQL
jgi:superfamily II DNA or RNA helicase